MIVKPLFRKILMYLLVIFVSSTALPQKRQIAKADKEFDKSSYIDARKIYLKVVEDGYESAQVFQKLGDTYYFNGEYIDASDWYKKAIDKYPSEVGAEYYYRAAQALKSIGNYVESDALMKEYEAKGEGNLVVKNFNEDPNYLESIAFYAKGYEIEKVSVNSDNSDFGPSFYLE